MTSHTSTHQQNPENLIKKLGIEDLPDEQKAKLIEEVSEVVEERLFLRLLEALPKDKADQFKALSEAGDAEQVQKFISQEVPHFISWVEEETEKIKDELEGLNKEIE